jgi:hypothetical protein
MIKKILKMIAMLLILYVGINCNKEKKNISLLKNPNTFFPSMKKDLIK